MFKLNQRGMLPVGCLWLIVAAIGALCEVAKRLVHP
jgi:hypothetical protein